MYTVVTTIITHDTYMCCYMYTMCNACLSISYR